MSKTYICRYCGKLNARHTRGGYSNVFCDMECFRANKVQENARVWISTGIAWSGAKKYVMDEQQHKCAVCMIDDTWNGKPIVFILDHIDGDSENNWPSNLRCVCPNCDSQLDTYKAKNKGKGRHTRKLRYQAGLSY